MIRLAFISDIHANLLALEAVIEDIQKQYIDEVLILGDIVGRGPQGSAVTKRIQKLGWRSIRGNHEDYTLAFRHKKIDKNWLTAPEWSAARWIAAELDDDDVHYLSSLPMTLTSTLNPEVRLFHGSPQSHREGIAPWTSQERCEEHLQSIKEPLFVCGHTHRSLLREFSIGTIINAGSVGLPFNGDHRSQYVILSFQKGELMGVDFRRISYDRDAFLKIYETSGFMKAGGLTAHLLKIELQTAQPYLTPFLRWVYGENKHPTYENMEAFLSQYVPPENYPSIK